MEMVGKRLVICFVRFRRGYELDNEHLMYASVKKVHSLGGVADVDEVTLSYFFYFLWFCYEGRMLWYGGVLMTGPE